MSRHFLILFILLGLYSCKSSKPSSATKLPKALVGEVEMPSYKASPTRTVDVYHTSLDIELDWEKVEVKGLAKIKLGVHRTPLTSIDLDAKFMLIHSVKIGDLAVKFKSSDSSLSVLLDSSLVFGDTLELEVNYTSRPSLANNKKNAAIENDKGFYFINADESDKLIPKQAWTQGQTQSNSVWFPTVDRPNERMTFDLAILLDSSLTSLSNGDLDFQESLPDGKRKDFWSMKKPIAPYLVMMAVGPFERYQEPNSELPIGYLVEKEWISQAKGIFGKTPKMIETFGKILNYPYPWSKYDQIVGRDYVSGAMENTGAVLLGDFLYQDQRQRLDGDNEDIIAHELFHHWFGDLVTCESWSNLTLNEGFASYGEYLWREAAYGKNDADAYLEDFLGSYLQEADEVVHPLIHYRYDSRDQMFDHHSYDKGAVTLHYLRWVLGDENFFGGLNFYLSKHAYKSVEIHDLRIALEEYTGLDLNWFFENYFLSEGHPVLEYDWSSADGHIELEVEQVQEKGKASFEIPLGVEIFTDDGKKTYKRIRITKAKQNFKFDLAGNVQYVHLDPEGVIPGLILESKSYQEYRLVLKNTSGYRARLIGSAGVLLSATESGAPISDVVELLETKDEKLLANIILLLDSHTCHVYNLQDKLEHLMIDGASSDVRTNSIEAAMAYYAQKLSAEKLERTVYDPSLMVAETGLTAIMEVDFDRAIELAGKKMNSKYIQELSPVAFIFSVDGDPSEENFFLRVLESRRTAERYEILSYYVEYLLNGEKPEVQKRGADYLVKYLGEAEEWWYKVLAVEGLKGMHAMYREQLDLYVDAEVEGHSDGIDDLQNKKKLGAEMTTYLREALDRARENESDSRIKVLLR